MRDLMYYDIPPVNDNEHRYALHMLSVQAGFRSWALADSAYCLDATNTFPAGSLEYFALDDDIQGAAQTTAHREY